MDRRTMLIALGGAAVAGAGASYFFLNNEPMNPAPQRDGKVLCDIHAHPTHKASLEEITQGLSSPGLVGLTVKNIDKSGEDILTYEQASERLGKQCTQLDTGRLAKYKDGYFCRTQELLVGRHHVLALGWQGDYFPNYNTIEQAVTAIHKQQGIAILTHPFALAGGSSMALPQSPQEQEIIRNAYKNVDEVEVHNAFCIDLIPNSLAMRKANEAAEQLRETQFPNFKGTYGGDCHRQWNQIKLGGMYVDTSVIERDGMDGLKNALVQGQFERYGSIGVGPYVSRFSFLRGVLGDMWAIR